MPMPMPTFAHSSVTNFNLKSLKSFESIYVIACRVAGKTEMEYTSDADTDADVGTLFDLGWHLFGQNVRFL